MIKWSTARSQFPFFGRSHWGRRGSSIFFWRHGTRNNNHKERSNETTKNYSSLSSVYTCGVQGTMLLLPFPGVKIPVCLFVRRRHSFLFWTFYTDVVLLRSIASIERPDGLTDDARAKIKILFFYLGKFMSLEYQYSTCKKTPFKKKVKTGQNSKNSGPYFGWGSQYPDW